MNLEKRIQIIIDDIKAGKPILIVDDPSREGEIDAFIAAEKATESSLAFFMTKCRGLMCVTMTKERAKTLEIPSVPSNNRDKFSTAFQCPVDAAEGVTTGMSAKDRMVTLSLLVDDNTTPDQLSYPGHLQILLARDGLFGDRKGHTESSIVCTKLAEVQPVGVIVEIIKDDGTMAKSSEVEEYADSWGWNYISVKDLGQYCEENNLSWATGILRASNK